MRFWTWSRSNIEGDTTPCLDNSLGDIKPGWGTFTHHILYQTHIGHYCRNVTGHYCNHCNVMKCNSYLVTWLQLYKNSTWWHDWRKRQWFNGVTVRQWKRVRNLRLTLIVLILIMVTVCNTGCWWCWLCWHWWWLECWSFWWWCR